MQVWILMMLLLTCIVKQVELNLLKFWSCSQIKRVLPKLSKLAIGVFLIAESSSANERAFSICTATVNKQKLYFHLVLLMEFLCQILMQRSHNSHSEHLSLFSLLSAWHILLNFCTDEGFSVFP